MAQEQTQSSSQNEYEREPVPAKALLGFKSFVGMYAGEHCAGTELMIGPLFVAAGVSAFDLITGLLVGNALAVLSWMLLCAPIATRSRLTLYYQLEKICGRKLVTLYNLANGVMFCFLAGAMVTVSATAIGVFCDFPMPGLADVYPNSVGWVLAVGAVGLVISLVAALGYKTVARIANIASPWMVLIFALLGVVGLSQFIQATGTEVKGVSGLWQLANESIWKGGEPLAGKEKFTFWHVMFFAWFCNMAMHVGMSDLTVFRYAKKSWYALASASGMYVGHFMAWISASLLYAYQLQVDPSNTDVLPGPMVYKAAGFAGLVCVIIAGWTTANPTIYRAGLAFQAIMPRTSRFWVTFCTGLLATVAGMFPAIAMKLLDFVALYGLMLMPMGAIVFVDFWLMKKLRLKSNFAELSGSDFNWGAAASWFIVVPVCWYIQKQGYVSLFMVSLPGWFLAAIIYIISSYIYQNRLTALSSVQLVSRGICYVSLAALVYVAVAIYNNAMTLDAAKAWLAVITVFWFVFAAVLKEK
ncbi:MAG: hypothetical protein JXM68_03785 [Sedimentisphaerales bacterium]|nr:hypothetical protein [Sedimentisphaerales bacterium]